jgi:hypothetical protein
MPLAHGSSQATVSRNISEMVHAGHPQNQAVAAALRAARKGRAYGGGDPIPDRLSMTPREASQRVPQLTEGAGLLSAGQITAPDYGALVRAYKPVRPYSSLPPLASHDDLRRALSSNKHERIGKLNEYPEGHPVSLRLDIPAYTNHGIWAPTVHDRKTAKPISYESAAHITDAQFGMPEKAALKIAAGGAKAPFASIHGKLVHTPPEEIHALVSKHLNDPEWAQVGMDPERHSYFYDRKTEEPILSAARVLQSGPLVLAHRPVYGARQDQLFAAGGAARARGGPVTVLAHRATSGPVRDDEGRPQYWTDHRPAAEGYADARDDPNITTRQLTFKNPYRMLDDAATRRLARRVGTKWDVHQPYWDVADHPNTPATLREMGHDGLIFSDSTGAVDHKTYMTLPPDDREERARGGAIAQALRAARQGGGGVEEPDEPAAAPAPAGPPQQTRASPGGLPRRGVVPGGQGLLPPSIQGGDEPLAGLPRKVKIPQVGSILAGPNQHIRRVAWDYMARRGMPYTPPRTYAKVDPERAKRIAVAYDEARHDPQHPLTHAAYDAMVRETMDQYVAAKHAGFRPEFWPKDGEDPYGPSPRLAIEDINRHNHMYVYPTRLGYGAGIRHEDVADNPLLQDSGERWNGHPVTVNDIFRATHDYFGHAKEGVGFRHDGEENAWRAHAAMYSPLARIAMTNETRGQNSWVNFGPHSEHNQTARGEDTVFAPQKIATLPAWAVHEGAEDFLPPEDRHRVEAVYKLLPRRQRREGGQIKPQIAPSDLFDMSLLHETPNVPQFDLPRYEPPRGAPARVADLAANPAVREKMLERIHKGRLVGSIWYNAEPLRQEFVKAHGEDTGNRIFRRYMDYVAATSPQSDIGTNARNASYYLHRDITGQGMPTGEKVFEGGTKKLPQPYGHKAQDLHIRNARRIYEEGGWDPLENPKPRSFVENLVGNQRPATVDTHAMKLPAMLSEDPRFLLTSWRPDSDTATKQKTPARNLQAEVQSGVTPMSEALRRAAFWENKPNKTEYGAMERYYQGLGQEAGLSPGQAQASAWVGGGDLTGLKSVPDMPFMTALHDRVMRTAKTRGMDPRDVTHQFVTGQAPLLARGGRTARAEGGPLLFHSNLHGGHGPHVPHPHAPHLHVGPIHSSVHGRTDHLPMHVPSGSYVLPADVVSAHGEGNTMAGFKVMRRVFGGMPYGGAEGGPYGKGSGPYDEPLSRGGRAADGGDQGVPIVAAGGEYVLSPDEVRAVGHGDAELGTKVLDEWVKRSRAKNIKTLRGLPGPAKD